MPEAPEWYRAYLGAGGTPRPVAASPAAAPATAAPRPAPGTGVAAYLPLIQAAAGRYKVDPSLLAGVVDFESSGNPAAVNRASGATGLGQVMPREAGFAGRPTRQELLDPATNLDWSARILSEGIQRYGTEDQGLAAYLGAIDRQGRITGALDANGTGGNQYIRTVRERQGRYASPGPSPAGAPGQGAQARAPAAAPAPQTDAAPAWYRQFLQRGGAAPAAPPGGTPATAARPPTTGPSEPGAAPGKQPGWLELASSQLGKPYIWGSAGGRSNFSLDAPGYDCSGFVAQVYKNAFGVAIPAFTGSAYPATKPVAAQEAQPGDLVFWNMGTPDPRRQHVAIYIGDGKVIQSGGQGDGVNIAPVTQMPGAEFRRSPAAYANYSAAPDPQRVSPGSPDRPGAVWLQGTVARTPGAAEAATATSGGPDWYRQYLAGVPRAQGGS